MASDTVRAEINVTPLIDVMLVLLILFMVVAQVSERGLDASLPQPPVESDRPSKALVLQVEPLGFVLDSRPVAGLTELEDRLRDAFETRRDPTLFVRTVPGVAYGAVIDAMDVARAAGAQRIGVIR